MVFKYLSGMGVWRGMEHYKCSKVPTKIPSRSGQISGGTFHAVKCIWQMVITFAPVSKCVAGEH